MRYIESLVTILRVNGFPRGFVNTDYMTTRERIEFEDECRRQGVLAPAQASARRAGMEASR